MATILDVAKLAGVSQGTVSNVLNRKGNVSSKKIKLVEDAARALGYTINEKAKMLRQGYSDSFAVILPNIQSKQYRDFYTCLKVHAEKNGFSTELMLSNDNPDEEVLLLQQAKAALKQGIAVVSCLDKEESQNLFQDFRKVCFIERRPNFPANFYGFDYKLCGAEMARALPCKQYSNILLVYESIKYSNIHEIVKAFRMELSNKDYNIVEISTDIQRISRTILEIMGNNDPFDAIVTTNFGFAEKIRQIADSLLMIGTVPIYTVSPVFTLPEKDYKKYELNYHLLGRRVAEDLISSEETKQIPRDCILSNDGYRNWDNILIKKQKTNILNVLALEGPEAQVMKGMARLYEEKTGTKVNISVFSYDETYEAFVNAESFGGFDIFRIDVTWLSWFAEKIMLPLETVDPEISNQFREYIPDLPDKYSRVHGKVYALPVTPSAQLLFYRKDLFEDVSMRRAYLETFKCELNVPSTFEEFNRIASFFTKSINNASKVQYGTSLILGNTGAAATEFLTRFFSQAENLYTSDGKISINNPAGTAALNNLLEATKYIHHKNISWWTEGTKVFSDGDVAMEITFSNYASEILGYRSKIIDKVGCSMVPGGNPVLGGGSLAIAKTCKYPEDALAFMKWFTSDPVSSAMAALGSVSPCLKTYGNYEIVDAFPWLEISKECFSQSKTGRLPPQDSRPFDEKRFQSIIGGMIKNVCSGVIEAERALEIAQEMIDQHFNR